MTKEYIERKIKNLMRDLNYYKKVYPHSDKIIDIKNQINLYKKKASQF